MLEADALDRVRQLEVDRQIVAIELEVVVWPESTAFLDIHR